jgi:hypothetical protein
MLQFSRTWLLIVAICLAFSHGSIASILRLAQSGDLLRLLNRSSINKPLQTPALHSTSIMSIRGGEVNSIPSIEKSSWSMRRNLIRNALGVWGVVQVLSVLANAIKRLLPVALQPLKQNDMLPFQWVLYITWGLYMMYAEGYKAFQKKFSPMVVMRAFSLIDSPSPLNIILAGPYSMGMFGASKKRMIIAWSVTAGVFSLVKVVKLFPYPYRAIVDAGVVLGLSYGALSIIFFTIKALLGGKVEAKDN